MGAKERRLIRDARSRTNPESEYVGHPHESRKRLDSQESKNKATTRECRDGDFTKPIAILRRHHGGVLQKRFHLSALDLEALQPPKTACVGPTWIDAVSSGAHSLWQLLIEMVLHLPKKKGRPTAICASATARGEHPVFLERHAV